MLVFRPVTLDDLDSLMRLAEQAGFGLTTLPKDRELLLDRIVDSERSFQGMGRRPRGDMFLFVVEDVKTGEVVGTAGIISKVGGFEPFYAYRIERAVHESESLGVHKEVPTLHLVEEHNGPCEIGSLFLDRRYRKDGNGRMLSLARLLFIAEFRDRFDPMVIAEMRGRIDARGGSVFWDAIGRHFFDIEFPKADYLSMVSKKFIGELMPRHPIYIPLLPQEAQDVIGKVHEETEAALKILEHEGFQTSGMVDVFEGGPIVRCRRDDLLTVRESIKTVVADVSDEDFESDTFLISNTRHQFRVCKGQLRSFNGGICLKTGTALALQLKVGNAVRYVAMRRPPEKEVSHVGKEEPVYKQPMG